MNKKHMACVVVLLVIIGLVQGTIWMNNRMIKLQSGAAAAERAAIKSGTQLRLEQKQLTELKNSSKGLIDYLNLWQPYFEAVDSSENAELKISLKIKEDDLLSLSQRYSVISQKNSTLPKLMRADVTFEDNYANLLNWLGRLEADLPTMRITSINARQGTGAEDLTLSLVLEQPILNTR
jgi:hypothetical protein